jgi:PASTA domain
MSTHATAIQPGPSPATRVVLAMLSSICVTAITNALDTSPTVSLIGATLAAAVPALINAGGTHGALLGVGLTAVALGVTYVGFTAFDTATDRPPTFPVPAKVQQQADPVVPPGNIELPDVVGSVYGDAEAKLKDAGVSVTRQEVESDEQPETVVAQNPIAGTTVNANTTATLSVSNTRVEVPNVVQQDAETAQATLEELGLTVEVSPREVADPSQDGVVLEQSLAGEAQAGATITLTVGALPTITVPTMTSP